MLCGVLPFANICVYLSKKKCLQCPSQVDFKEFKFIYESLVQVIIFKVRLVEESVCLMKSFT